MTIDFPKINSAALAQFNNLLASWLPGGRVEGHEYICGDLTGGTGRSLSVNLQSGIWKDFATDVGGQDPVSLYAAINGMKQGEAARALAQKLGIDLGNGTSAPRGKARITKTYDYHDAAGNLLFQVVRLEPKSFRQRRPDGKGGWTWSVKGVEMVPYRLPDLLEANVVFICEGEKDCNRLASLGLVATCNAMGAGKWKPEYAKWFEGKTVFILPDNDTAGRQHAQQVARSLQGKASVVKVLALPELPEKGDVSDFLDSGGTVEQLQVVAQQAPGWTPDPGQDNAPDSVFAPMSELLAAPVRTEWVIKRILDRGMCVLFGEAESMKTFVAIDQAVAIACEDNWHGHKIPQNGPVFYICGEGRQGIAKRFKARTQAAKAPEDAPVFVSNAPMQGMDADSVRGIMDSIDDLSRKHGAPVVLFIDTLNRNFGAGDESSTKDMTTFIANLDNEIKRRFDVAVVIVHHSGLVDKDRSRGSGALRAALDWEYKLTTNSDNVRTLTCTKCKDHDKPEAMHFLPEIIDLPWKDEDGEPMTSVVLRLTEPPTARDAKLTGAKRVAKDALFHLTCLAKKDNPDAPLIGPVPINIEDWREAAYQRGISPSEKQDAKKKAFQRAVTGLLDRGIVEADGDYYTLL